MGYGAVGPADLAVGLGFGACDCVEFGRNFVEEFSRARRSAASAPMALPRAALFFFLALLLSSSSSSSSSSSALSQRAPISLPPPLPPSPPLSSTQTPRPTLSLPPNRVPTTWVLLLKAHRAVGKLTGVASAALSVAAAARRRVAAGRTDFDAPVPGESPVQRTRFYGCLRAFLLLSMLLLAVDVAAHVQGWHLVAVLPDLPAVEGLFAAGYASWVRVRLNYLASALQFLANACVVLFLIQSVDRLILCLGCLWIRLKGIKPVLKTGGGKGLDDVEASAEEFPMVLVQIPMCNEKEVYQQSIGAVCNLDWPRSNFLVQVLDDSDDAATSALIKEEVEKWQQEGVRILYRHRVIRDGYKAGNLKSAMNCSYVKDYEFVVIFDADFQPQADFLKRAVPHFKGNEDVGLVQARMEETLINMYLSGYSNRDVNAESSLGDSQTNEEDISDTVEDKLGSLALDASASLNDATPQQIEDEMQTENFTAVHESLGEEEKWLSQYGQVE